MPWMTARATLKMIETELTRRHIVRTVTHINRGRWGGLDLSGLIPLGNFKQCPNLHYTFHFSHVSVLFPCFMISGFGNRINLARLVRETEVASFLVLSGLGRAGDRLCLDSVELCLGDAGLVCFTRRTPHWKPTRASRYATTFFPFPCFAVHSCKVVPHFCENNVCTRKVLESFEAR